MNSDIQAIRAMKVDPEAEEFVRGEYARLYKDYNCAIREVRTKLEVLNDDFELAHQHNPIHSMNARVKSVGSIIEKCYRMNYPLEDCKFTKYMMDIAGIRVICHYIDDIYTVAELLGSQPDIEVVTIKDYIENPKPNGYRSLHLVVKVPVYFVEGVKTLPVEVQIRTMAMDFWASLEHKLRYKSDGTIPAFVSRELKECAEAISNSDQQMQKIHSFLDQLDQDLARM